MASAYLTDLNSMNNHQLHTSSAADTALCAFEKGMFGAPIKAQEQTNESNPDSLSYLFSIFAY
jgi:hypothetical protein